MADYYSSKEYYAKKEAALAKTLERKKLETSVKEVEEIKSTSIKEPDSKSYVVPTDVSASAEVVVVSEDTISTVREEDLTSEELLEEISASIPEYQVQTQSELNQQNLNYTYGSEQIRLDELAAKKKLVEEKLEEYNIRKQKHEECLSDLRGVTDTELRKQKERGCIALKNELDVSLLIYQDFITSKPQPLAPPGYHQMADGSIMSDAEHPAYENLPKCGDAKYDVPGVGKDDNAVILGIDFDHSDIDQGGETRSFKVSATNGSTFSLEIKSSAGKYYNFYSNSFTTAYASLKNATVYGTYEFSVVFPEGTVTTYDIFLIAQDDTSHAGYAEVLLDDNTIDLNSSTGSNSKLLHKQLRQSRNETLTYELSAKSPNSVANLSDHASITGQGFLKGGNSMLGIKTDFSFSVTSGSTKAYQILKQPTFEDIFVEVTRTIGSAPIFLDGEDISSSTHYSWPLDNIDGLTEDMIPIGTNVTANSVIKYYENTVTPLENTACANEFTTTKIEPLTKTAPPTLTRNATSGMLVKTQLGNVTFDKQQAAALANGEIKFLAYGPEKIKELTGWELELTNLKVELTKPTTTTTQSTVNLTTVTIASGDGIADDVSTVSGIGISGASGAPTITDIAGYSGTTATITFDSAQTLENGTTLTFHGAGETITISGSIVFKTTGKSFGTNYELPGWDGKFYFDLEKFITPTAEAS